MKRSFGASKLLIATVVLVLGALASLATARSAFAGFTTCDTDPSVTLSNGVTVTMWTTVPADVSQISSITYVLHVPKGVSSAGITYDQYGYLEHVQIVADQYWNKYVTETTVTTPASTVPVIAWVSTTPGNIKQSAVGFSGHKLVLGFKLSLSGSGQDD